MKKEAHKVPLGFAFAAITIALPYLAILLALMPALWTKLFS